MSTIKDNNAGVLCFVLRRGNLGETKLSGRSETRQTDSFSHSIENNGDRQIDAQIGGVNIYDVAHEARAFVELHDSNIVGGIVDKLWRFVLADNGVRIDYAMAGSLDPTYRRGTAVHTVQARVELVSLALFAVLQN